MGKWAELVTQRTVTPWPSGIVGSSPTLPTNALKRAEMPMDKQNMSKLINMRSWLTLRLV